jgi:carbamoyl-phosphate synthase small subunit
LLPSLFPETTPAILALADGTIFRGTSIGAPGHTVGEVVFNTAITGYQEIVTDPSYSRQIVTLTYPHIGNTGINAEDEEASRIHAAGLVVRDYSLIVSNFRSERSLSQYLTDQNVVGIADIDTRKLTRILREKGAQGGCIYVGTDEKEALRLAREFPGMAGLDLAKVVTVKQQYGWTDGIWTLGAGHGKPDVSSFHVVAMDFGIKRNILRLLAESGCRVTVVPAETNAADILALEPDGIFLANGPGDPEPCEYAVRAVRVFLECKIPLFGICLGHQLLGLAVGGKTLKMKFGHHGANHPVQEVATGRVFITSQNHGFAVDPTTLPATARITHVSLFDGSLQGFELTDRPAFCFQGHPEASPGPHDIDLLFERFVQLMQNSKQQG